MPPTRALPASPYRAIVLTVLGSLFVALVTAAARGIDEKKLDVSRFEADSINNVHERRADRLILLRIDSTTQVLIRRR